MIEHRFYSNLMPVQEDAYDRSERRMIIPGEPDISAHDHVDNELKVFSETFLEDALFLNYLQAESPEGDSIIVKRIPESGRHYFAVDIKYHFGLEIPLLVTKEEASAVISVAKTWQATMPEAGRKTSALLSLPREIREKIYELTLCQGRWWIADEDGPTRRDFCRAMGDPVG
ncbi:hypothetical protein E5D57_003334 [Metarhizium anisopliae]|nr:hypothetical protein E5D57_003334 [Metarhizium anisopliae]